MGTQQSGWSKLKREAIEALDASTFEDLCEAIVRYEASQRHDGAIVDGPSGTYVADGGRDILLTVRSAPTRTKLDFQRDCGTPVTEDALARTAYSCKTGDWFTLAMRDARDERRMKRSVEVLDEGGYFKVFVSAVAKRDAERNTDDIWATPQAHLVRVLATRLTKLVGTPLEGRVEIIDAGDIHNFLVTAEPTRLLARFSAVLGLVRELSTCDEWKRFHDSERIESPFQTDPVRDALAADLHHRLRTATDQRVTIILGPSGIGKTRFLLWALGSDSTISQRVRVTYSHDDAREALENNFVGRHPDVVMVVDDCSEDDALRITSLFASKTMGHEKAHLLVLVPTVSLKAPRGLASLTIERLTDASAAKLVSEIAPKLPEEDVNQIVQLSEGYAWFAILLAHEASLEDRPPRSINEAVDWVLASRHEANEQILSERRLQRCRALAAVALTRLTSLDKHDHKQRTRLARAVGLPDWDTLFARRKECASRGLVRPGLGQHFSYVTPLILEREVLRRLFGPDGPDRGAAGLQAEAPDLHASLIERAESLAIADLRGELAAAIIEHLEAAPRLFDLPKWPPNGAPLDLAAREQPQRCAAAIQRLVSQEPLDKLGEPGLPRRDLVWALEVIASGDEGLEASEDALFRLAQAETEVYGNNATRVWTGLYAASISPSWTFQRRLELLRLRVHGAPHEGGVLALSGVESLLETRTFRYIVHRPIQASVPMTIAELSSARELTWELLTQAAHAQDPQVAARARQILIEQLRGAVRARMASAALKAAMATVSVLTTAERTKLRGKIEEISAYETEMLGSDSIAFEELAERVRPVTFGERLRDALGRWPTAPERVTEDVRDHELAREAVGHDAEFEVELDWLLTDEGAVRARAFLRILGEKDKQARFLSDLLTKAHGLTAEYRAAAYLGGYASWAEASRIQLVLDELFIDESRTRFAVLATVEAGLDDDRIQQLTPLLKRPSVDAVALAEVGRRFGLAKDVGPATVELLTEALLDLGSDVGVSTCLEILERQLRRKPESADALTAVATRALDEAARLEIQGAAEHDWEAVALALVERGDVRPAARAAFAMLRRIRGSGHDVWPVIKRAFQQDPETAWQELAKALEVDSLVFAVSFRFVPFGGTLPVDSVLVWIGSDAQRAALVASIVEPFAAPLHPVLRALIRRFGPQSSAAKEIAARMHSSQGMVSSMVQDDSERLAYARAWTDDEDAMVRLFASNLVGSLEQSLAYHMAKEEAKARRFGT